MKRFPAPFQFQPLAFSLQTFPRHWLAGVLAKERPALFRDLPESFKVGHPLPQRMVGTPRCGVLTPQRDVPTKPRFVHGCELLAA